ncbi:linear amide C-N hydrolase [Synechocystis salina]|uniref:linear amide C-N hydrolase n=1 Tax=Synechocystis salina TaxID=945780 RepID=UPI0039080E2B
MDPKDRFVRASYYQMMLPEPKTEQEAIAGILAIARNVSVPFGAPNNLPGSLYNTEYRTAIDLTNRRYFFELTTSPNVIWVNLDQLNFVSGATVLSLDPDNLELSGNVTDKFVRVTKIPF